MSALLTNSLRRGDLELRGAEEDVGMRVGDQWARLMFAGAGKRVFCAMGREMVGGGLA